MIPTSNKNFNSVGYLEAIQDEARQGAYIGETLFKRVNIKGDAQSDRLKVTVPEYTRTDTVIYDSMNRAPKAGIQTGQPGTYDWKEYRVGKYELMHEYDVDYVEQEAKNWGSTATAERKFFVEVAGQVMTAQEKEIATILQTISNYASGHTTNYVTAGDRWDQVDTDIYTAIMTAKDKIKTTTRKIPNVLVFDEKGFENVKKNASIRGFLPTTVPQVITKQFLLTVVFPWLDDIIIGDTIYKTEDKVDSPELAIWSNDCMLLTVGKTSKIEERCFGSAVAIKHPLNGTSRTITNNNRNYNYIYADYVGYKIKDNASGYLFKQIYTTS